MYFTQEIQQLLLVHSLPATSMGTISFIQASLHASLSHTIERLRYAVRRLNLPSSTPANAPTSSSTPPYDLLLLLIHRQNAPLFYRIAQYLSWEQARKKAKVATSAGLGGLDMPDEEHDPSKDPEDSWWNNDDTNDASGIPSLCQSVFQALDSLAMFEEHANLPITTDFDNESDWLQKAYATPGLVHHFVRMKSMDSVTAGMAPSDYVQFAETRDQASFYNYKAKTPRFREFIEPELLRNEIVATDELVELLAFIAFEMVSELIEQAKKGAQVRVKALREEEGLQAAKQSRANRAQAKLDAAAELSASSSKKRKAPEPPSKAHEKGQQGGKKPAKSVKQIKLEQEKEADIKRREENLAPTGPFSAPSMQTASTGMLTCPANASLVDGEEGSTEQSEALKVDSSKANADIVSGYDVMLADFEEVLQGESRKYGVGSLGRRRGTRFCDVCR